MVRLPHFPQVGNMSWSAPALLVKNKVKNKTSGWSELLKRMGWGEIMRNRSRPRPAQQDMALAGKRNGPRTPGKYSLGAAMV